MTRCLQRSRVQGIILSLRKEGSMIENNFHASSLKAHCNQTLILLRGARAFAARMTTTKTTLPCLSSCAHVQKEAPQSFAEVVTEIKDNGTGLQDFPGPCDWAFVTSSQPFPSGQSEDRGSKNGHSYLPALQQLEKRSLTIWHPCKGALVEQ